MSRAVHGGGGGRRSRAASDAADRPRRRSVQREETGRSMRAGSAAARLEIALELVEEDGAVVAQRVDVARGELERALEVVLGAGAVVELGVDQHAVAGEAVDVVGLDLERPFEYGLGLGRVPVDRYYCCGEAIVVFWYLLVKICKLADTIETDAEISCDVAERCGPYSLFGSWSNKSPYTSDV